MKTQDKFEERVDDILYEIINVFENHQQSCDDVHCGILQISLKEILGKAIREAREEGLKEGNLDGYREGWEARKKTHK